MAVGLAKTCSIGQVGENFGRKFSLASALRMVRRIGRVSPFMLASSQPAC
jgi:hypothetical protein